MAVSIFRQMIANAIVTSKIIVSVETFRDFRLTTDPIPKLGSRRL